MLIDNIKEYGRITLFKMTVLEVTASAKIWNGPYTMLEIVLIPILNSKFGFVKEL